MAKKSTRKSKSTTKRSGGININADIVNITGDVTGRDKTVGDSKSSRKTPPPPSNLSTTPPSADAAFEYDVFISYSSKDKDWVRGELLHALEQNHLRVCVDFRDFRPGAPSIKEIERAVLTSRKTLLILTPDYLASEWTEFENLLLQTLEPSNQNLRLIPLLKEKCDLPLRLKFMTYVNFVDPDDWNIAWRQLFTALGAAPFPEAPAILTPETWYLPYPYPMPPNFTGRFDERRMLSKWLGADPHHPLFVLRALGGFGKSALAWQWLTHDVSAQEWPRVVWWSFYEGDASFDNFLRDTLNYLRVNPRSPSPHEQVEALLNVMRKPGILLVLDGFERQLRAFGGMTAAYQGDVPVDSRDTVKTQTGGDRDCANPLAELFLRGVSVLPNLYGKVLMTTRLTPQTLQAPGGAFLNGCYEEELKQMEPAEAVIFLRARGVRGSRAEIESACRMYGYHPLSLSLLVGLIVSDLQQPGDVAISRRLNVIGDLVPHQHHVLEVAYNSLTPARQKLLSRIACFRSGVTYDALHALANEDDAKNFDNDLHDLLARGLLHRDDKTNRYDLHPIVRRYAYDRLTANDRTTAHSQLRDYFAALPTPDKVKTLDDLLPVIELYHHTVNAGQYDEARELYRDRLDPLYYQLGAYQLITELMRPLFPNGEDRPPRLKDESAQAWTLNELANSYSLSGQPRRAVPLFERQVAIREKQGVKQSVAIGLGNVAIQQMIIGALKTAEANLRRRIDLCREIEDEFNEAIGHQELGRLLAYRGVWQESEEELNASQKYDEKQNDLQGLSVDHAYRSLRTLLMSRTLPSPPRGEGPGGEALSAARHALELADEQARDIPVERDYVRAHWLLGAAHRLNDNLIEAERHMSEALMRCRNINAVDGEADILIDLARLRVDQNEGEEALRLAGEALLITERSEYVLQGADVHLFLAQMALQVASSKLQVTKEQQQDALYHAREARRLATCDGEPYVYRVAYDEAGELLKKLA